MQFQALREMVHTNPQILQVFYQYLVYAMLQLHSLSKHFAGISLQPMLQELSKQNPQLLRLIQENNDEFLQLLNETFEGGDG